MVSEEELEDLFDELEELRERRQRRLVVDASPEPEAAPAEVVGEVVP